MKSIFIFSILFFQSSFVTFDPLIEITPNPKLGPAEQVEDGLTLLQKHCYTCHNPKSKSHDEIIAPPLWGMKKHYLDAYPEKMAFEKAMFNFIQNPTEEKALMKGPIKRFGLMPKPAVSTEDLQKIVSYIYANELENPAWHIEKDNQKKSKSDGLM